MPVTHKNPPPLKRDYTPARTLRERYGLENGHFRCDRCHRVLPEAVAVEQDGLTLCPLDRDRISRSELDLLLAQQTAEVDTYEPCEDPATNAFDGAVVVTDVEWSDAGTGSTGTQFPAEVDATETCTITLTGINFASSTDVTITHNSDSDLDDVLGPDSTTITSTSIVIEVSQGAAVTGNDYYWTLSIDGTRYRKAIYLKRVGLFP